MNRSIFWAAVVVSVGAVSASAEPFDWALPDWMPRPVVPQDNPMTAAKVELGRHLFYDARLSADETIACSSCHEQARAFTDGRETAIGINKIVGGKNAPPLMNVAFYPVLTWANPHMTSLEFQSLIPLFGESPDEMGASGREAEVFDRLGRDAYYASAFAEVFPDRPAPDLFTVTRALAAFERSLTSFDSAYDRFKYGGDLDALSAAALRGEQLFFDHRFECYHCHQGVLFSDNFQTEGSPWAETGFHNTGLYSSYSAGVPGLSRSPDNLKMRAVFARPVCATSP